MVKKRDIFYCLIMCFLLVCVIYYKVGGSEFVFDVPLVYTGGDDTSYASEVKMMLDENSWLHSDRLGAPYGTDRSSTVSYYLFNDVHLLSFLFVKLTKSVGKALNLTYFCVIILTALNSFIVMRSRKIDPIIAVLGSVTFSCLPYMFLRNIGHLMLSAYQFVPFVILLCLWIFEDDEFFALNKDFFKYKRNIWAILLAFLVANNGIGYYPFFSCCLLLIAGISKSMKNKQLLGIKQALCEIFAIVLFMCLLLSNCIISVLSGGNISVAERTLGDCEVYSLKIARLFIPTWGTGIDYLDNIFSQYSGVEVCRGEATEFIGYLGIIGIIILLFALFIQYDKKAESKDLKILAELNIYSILFATVGGLNIFVFLFATNMVRCTNRISVFIAFIAILSSCIAVTEIIYRIKKYFMDKQTIKQKLILAFCYFAFGMFAIEGIHVQTKGVFLNNNNVAARYYSDASFIQSIEKVTPEGGMIFQLPNCKYPSGGFVGNMISDKLFIGYLHSDKLKWSYGAQQNEKSAMWNQYVGNLNTEEMLNALCEKGFSGIYIDSTAYTIEEFENLKNDFGYYLDDPKVSSDETLFFYSLSSYAQSLQNNL